MAYDVASGTGTPDASTQMGLMSSPKGGLDNLQSASATGGFVLSPVEHDPWASSNSSGSSSGASSGMPISLEAAESHGSSGENLTQADKSAMAPYSQGMFDTHIAEGASDKNGPPSKAAGAPTPEIMSASAWPDFVSNLQAGEVPFDELPDEYKKALKGKENDYELMRMGITQPLASLTKSLFDSSGGIKGKDGDLGVVPASGVPSK